MVNFKEDERLSTLNHSCAHVMAQAVKHLYPHAKFWVGPVVKEGFYYDIDLGNDVEGYLRVSEISADRIEDATTRLNAGDEVEALITNIDRKNRSIQLSIRAKDAAEARDALDRLNADATAASGTTNLGALLKAKLEQK